ncbi:hypothetical protein GGC64_001977 [Mycobacterium sp. OAS707]|nr:hypothetical protein [Mycobacterium sp. OAS707]
MPHAKSLAIECPSQAQTIAVKYVDVERTDGIETGLADVNTFDVSTGGDERERGGQADISEPNDSDAAQRKG